MFEEQKKGKNGHLLLQSNAACKDLNRRVLCSYTGSLNLLKIFLTWIIKVIPLRFESKQNKNKEHIQSLW